MATARERIVNGDEMEVSAQQDVRCRASSIMSCDSDGFLAVRSRQNTLDNGATRGRGDSITSVDSDGFPTYLALTPKSRPNFSAPPAPNFSMIDHFSTSEAISGSLGDDVIPDASEGFTLPDNLSEQESSMHQEWHPECYEPDAEKPAIFKGLQIEEVMQPEYQQSINDIMKMSPRNFDNKIDNYLNEVMTLTPRVLTDKLDDYLAAMCADSYAAINNGTEDAGADIGISSVAGADIEFSSVAEAELEIAGPDAEISGLGASAPQ